MRRVSPLLALAAAVMAVGLLAGCGGDDDNGGGDKAADVKEKFDAGYRPINEEFLALGTRTAQIISRARGQTNSDLARTFSDLSAQVAALRTRLDALEAPPEYEADRERLSKVMEVIVGDLREISLAAAAGDADEARAQTLELAKHSEDVRTARRALARKTGAKV